MSAAREAFDAALASWLVRQAAAEERLTSFAFREGQPAVAIPAPTSQAELRRWIVGVVADPDVTEAMRGFAGSGRSMTDLTAEGTLGLRPGDRVALAARLGVLAAGGLVTRELEADRVRLTELGRAALALADETAPAATAAPVSATAPAATSGGRA
jgi:hypothetical protein